MLYEKVIKLFEEFRDSHFSPKVREMFHLSEFYDLFPEKAEKKSCSTKWPAPYPFKDYYGVYLIIDDNLDVIYIGESNSIGRRLSDYFGYADDGSCKVKSSYWSSKPRYVVVIAVDDNIWGQRLALEEYLIYYSQPSDNTRSKNN